MSLVGSRIFITNDDGVEIINNGGQNLLKEEVKLGHQGIGAF